MHGITDITDTMAVMCRQCQAAVVVRQASATFGGLPSSMFISTVGISFVLKIIQALPNMSKHVTETEVINFLASKLNIQIATIDEEGYPMIQPIWFIYDKESSKIYISTQKMYKFQNIRRNPDKIYFSIDDENFPYKGVKGRAVARISEDIQKNLPIVEKIMIKYLGTIEHPFAKMGMEITRNGIAVVIELTPKFFSAWDLAKVM